MSRWWRDNIFRNICPENTKLRNYKMSRHGTKQWSNISLRTWVSKKKIKLFDGSFSEPIYQGSTQLYQGQHRLFKQMSRRNLWKYIDSNFCCISLYRIIPQNLDIEAINYYLTNYGTNLHLKFKKEFIVESVEFTLKKWHTNFWRRILFTNRRNSNGYYFCSYIRYSHNGLLWSKVILTDQKLVHHSKIWIYGKLERMFWLWNFLECRQNKFIFIARNLELNPSSYTIYNGS